MRLNGAYNKLYKFLFCLSIALLLVDSMALAFASLNTQQHTVRPNRPPQKRTDQTKAQVNGQASPDKNTILNQVTVSSYAAFYEDVAVIRHPEDLDILVNKYYILPEDYVPANLERIASKYSKGNQRLRTEARLAFEAFAEDVYDHTGQIPKAISSYRAYDRQSTVYLKYKTSGTLEDYQEDRDQVSARPGHSEHQLGLTVDVIRCSASVAKTPMYAYYKDHAHEYGFIVRYPEGKEAVTGYIFEPWHLRYLGAELATAVYNSGLTYDEYCIQVKGLLPNTNAAARTALAQSPQE